jgi:catechol 2,3-dioxygenase-like lactoylglutathione lyase family enzyme
MAAKPKTTRKAASAGGADKAAAPAVSLFRVTLEVTNIDRAKAFYEDLLGMKGKKLPGGRAHFSCGATMLELVDVSASGPSHPSSGPVYFSVPNLDAVHKRAKKLKCLSIELVHEKPGGAMVVRPWGERSFYADDPWFNAICFVETGTEYNG